MAEWDRGLSDRLSGVSYSALLVGLAMVIVWLAVVAGRSKLHHSGPSSTAGTEELTCQTLAHDKLLESLPEASGLALSLRTPNVLWSLNDSDAPVVIALDPAGDTIGRVRISGAHVNNWEDVSVAPCGNGSCLYVADTGKAAARSATTSSSTAFPSRGLVTRKPRQPKCSTRRAEGEDHEAEAVFAIDEQLFLVTKGHPSTLFRFPREMPHGSLATLERIGEVPTERFLKGTIPRRTRITDGETSPDGRWVALRTNEALLLYRSRDLIAGHMNNLWHADLRALDETQGEGVAISNDGDVLLAGEGGGRGLPGDVCTPESALPRNDAHAGEIGPSTHG
jgi:hypothetical protein